MVGVTRRVLSALSGLAAALILLAAIGNGRVFAQGAGGTALIVGTVTDATGSAVPQAAVSVRSVETGLTREVQADSDGSYRVPLLPVGAYEITAEKMGFRREVRRGIDLVVGQEARIDLKLEVGSVDQQVTVTGDAPLVNTTLASTSGLINESQIKDLPLNGRSFDQLIMLNVGTSNASSNTLNNSAWGMYSVAGKRPETNRFLINGVDWIGGNAPGSFITPLGISQQLLGVEAVREFNALTDTYGAEYGKRAGGQINIVTSSGTNQWHGDLFEFLRNSDFDARNFRDNTIGTPPFKRNQFGGMLGGPIKKDKLFFFLNYEGFRQALAFSSTAVVPSANARLGLMPNGSKVPNLNPAILPYANAFWPAPTGPDLGNGTAISFSNPPQSVREDFGLARLDYNLSTKDTLATHYNVDNGVRSQPFVDPAFNNDSGVETHIISMQETHIFSPNLVNIATLGFARTYATLVNVPAGSIPSDLVFMPGGNPGSIIIGGGVITASPSAVAAAGGNNLTIGVRNYFTESDDVRWNRGKHSFSFGGWLQRIQQNLSGQAQASAANVAYPTVLAFLQDKPSQAIVVRNPNMVGYRSFEAAWYIQDEIKLRSNLTVRLGLRDEMTNGWSEEAGRCSNYFSDPTYGIGINPHIGPSCLAQNNALALWQPRVGIAWDPTGTGTWAVRASAGIHNDLLDSLGQKAFNDPPFSAREQLAIPAAGFLALLPLNKNQALPPTCGPGAATFKGCAIYQPGGFDPNMFTPTIQMWTFTVERQLVKDLMLSVAYVGSQSYHTPLTMDTNSPAPQVCENAAGCLAGGVGTASATVATGTTYFPFTPPVKVNGVTLTQRPNPFVSNNQAYFNEGATNYNALNVSLVKRASHGLAFKVNYSYSKVIDLNSAALAVTGENEPADVFSPYDLALNRGPAAYSLGQQFNANFSYQLPFGKGQRFGGNASRFLNQLIGGWQWNAIFTAQGGFPFTPQIGSNISGTGDTNVSDVPNWNPNFKGPVVTGNPDHWFNPKAFLPPTPGTFGDVSRGSLTGPGLVDIDTSFFKKFAVTERVSMQLRAEAFNLLNHANFFYPNAIVFQGSNYSPTAGQIVAAGQQRELQLALKLIF
ncbi:MAG TPA: carboxypeptidase regulatory-like domain-containing protein [Bryobacteraceae bacterium]|nr:carboxypeptidase regulatory-like domain-containing protein [Bryobacteraceae bacterium]